MKTKGYWNKENCKKEALQYLTRSEFHQNSIGAYTSSLKKGWLDEVCSHMVTIGNNKKRCIYAIEFIDKHVYIGLTYNIQKRFKDHIKNVDYNNSPVLEHMNITEYVPIIKQVTDYIYFKDASIIEGIIKSEYENDGWLILNKAKCGSLGGNTIKWTKEECKKEASKFNTRGDFKKVFGWAYNISLKNGWLDEICSHMEYECYPNNYWDKEKCKKEASKYKTRREFNIKGKGAYNASVKNGWLDEICSHMKTIHNGYWKIKENCLKESLKYNSKTEFRKNCGGAYISAIRNKWIDEITEHMIKNKRYKNENK
jgi:hypothetical protein